MYRRILGITCALSFVPAVAVAAPPDEIRDYEVTITNLTAGQPFSPPVIATHRAETVVWHPNRPASIGVKEIAENGNNAPLLDDLRRRRSDGRIFDYQNLASTAMAPGPLLPAGRPGSGLFPTTVAGRIRASRRFDRLSWVSMLVCTNDGITGVDSVRLPVRVGRSVTIKSNAFETRTERNTEVLADIMPPCQGLIGVRSPSGAPGVAVSNATLKETGVIIPHAGVRGDAELVPAEHGWGNPVGKIVIRRVG